MSNKDHIIDTDKAEKLEDKSRYRFVSKEELLQYVDKNDAVAEIGSGTGFFTDDLAEVAHKVYGVDFQKQMHEFYRDKGVSDNVELIHARSSDIEIENIDAIVSIFSLHEIDLENSIETFRNTLSPNGKLIIFDWSSRGSGGRGPPLSKRLDAGETCRKLSSYFDIIESVERQETFKVVAELK
jgi:ubiquinone/menaquinone biosynthesis C-methylase UbiE